MRKLVLIVVVAISNGCVDSSPPNTRIDGFQQRRPSAVQMNPAANPRDFFPTAVGDRWRYRIALGDVEPLRAGQCRWPLGTQSAAYNTRGRFHGLFRSPEKRVFRLEYRVRATADQQGMLKFPLGVELEILNDELGVFDDAKQVFWAINTHDGRFMTHEVRVLDGIHSPVRSGFFPGADGCQIRILFFRESPQIAISLDGQDSDRLVFLGMDRDRMRFVREVQGGTDADALSDSFLEIMVYEKGKGLLRLEQNRGGKTAMTWTLEQFTPGRVTEI